MWKGTVYAEFRENCGKVCPATADRNLIGGISLYHEHVTSLFNEKQCCTGRVDLLREDRPWQNHYPNKVGKQ